MGHDPRQDFIRVLRALAKLCTVEVDDFIVEMYVRKLEPHGLQRAASALMGLFENARPGRNFPSINDVKERMGITVETDESKAIDATNRLISAIGQFGSQMTVEGTAKVEAHVGELAWATIKTQFNGWNSFCEMANSSDNLDTFKAQVRRDVLAVIERSRKGTLHTPPTLPERAGALLAGNPTVQKVIAEAATAVDITARKAGAQVADEKKSTDGKYPW